MKNLSILLIMSIMVIACKPETNPKEELNKLAEDYVKLVLKAGQHDPIFVDAYYGPEEWKPTDADKQPIEDLIKQTKELQIKLDKIVTTDFDDSWKLRHKFMGKQLIAVKARLNHVNGEKLPFDEQSKALFDAVAPKHNAEYFEEIVQELDALLPGKGDMNKRMNEFKKKLVIPKEKLDTVFKAAIAEGRKRTLKYIDIPENETFTLEFVTDKVWGGYNWYKGNYNSLIQVNTDLPKYIDAAVDLASHEGYPGHHVFNALIEKNLTNGKGWIEFSVYPLFSPQSLIAEGSANYGIHVAFPKEEKLKFEKEVLYPLAGLDPSLAEKYQKIQETTSKLGFARNEVGRNYLAGKWTKEQAIEWLMKYNLSTRERAEKSIDFLEVNESYIVNYNLGQEIVKNYIEKRAGDDPEKVWEVFKELLSNPYTASSLL